MSPGNLGMFCTHVNHWKGYGDKLSEEATWYELYIKIIRLMIPVS